MRDALVGFDTYLKAFAAVVCLVFAVIVLAGARARGPYLFLGAFLLLIAGNQGAETVRGLVADPAPSRLWLVAASVFAALDPFALYLFSRAYVGRALRGAPVMLAAAGAVALATVSSFVGLSDAVDRAFVAALLAYTALMYAIALASFLRGTARAPHDPRPRVLLYATGLVTLLPVQQLPYALVLAILFDGFGLTATPIPGIVGSFTWVALVLGIALVVVAAGRLENPSYARRAALGALSLGLAITAVVASSSLVVAPRLGAGMSPEPAWWPGVVVLGRASAALRWIAFGALVSMVIVRDDLLGMSLARRRAAARALVALGIAGLIGILYAAFAILFGADNLALRPLDWLLLSLVVIATQGFRPLIDAVAARLYGVPMPSDRVAAHEAYRRAAQQASAEGRDLHHDVELSRLRAELRIDDTQAMLIERVAEEAGAAPLVAGQRVAGRYRVLRLVGRGGVGRVFLARDETLQRDVVLKEVLHDEPGDDAALREARAAGAILHPNVVVVHDVIRRAGASLLVTEYVAGGSLAQRVATHGRLPLDEGLRVLDGVLAGLEAVHGRGLVHRDLKPDNVLLGEGGAAKIADFGIARQRRGVTARFDEPDAFIGTPEFMAPEQRAGTRATAATDVWGVGMLARQCIAQPLPPPIDAVVQRALASEPAARYAGAAEMRAALAAAMRGPAGVA